MPSAPSSRPRPTRSRISRNCSGVAVLSDRAVARQQRAGIVEDGHARRHVAAGSAVVDQRVAFALRVPRGNGMRAYLEFERGSDAVAGLEAIILGGLPVRVEIDEARRDRQITRVDGGGPGERCGRNRRDLAGADADVTHGVQIRRRVQHAAAGDHDVVRLGTQRKGEECKRNAHAAIVARDNRYMADDLKQVIDRQREAPVNLAALIAGKAHDTLRRAPAPGKWSIVEVIAHLAEDELASSWRYRQMLEHPGVELAGFDQDEWARRGKYREWDLRDALEMFRLLRAANRAPARRAHRGRVVPLGHARRTRAHLGGRSGPPHALSRCPPHGTDRKRSWRGQEPWLRTRRRLLQAAAMWPAIRTHPGRA